MVNPPKQKPTPRPTERIFAPAVVVIIYAIWHYTSDLTRILTTLAVIFLIDFWVDCIAFELRRSADSHEAYMRKLSQR